MQPVLFYEGYLYGNFNTDEKQKNPEGLVCLDLEGKMIWQSDKAGGYDMGNLLIADGMLFVMSGSSGEVSLLAAQPRGYQELGRCKVFAPGKHAFAPMALAGGRLIVRDQREMKCLDVRASSYSTK